MRSFKGQILIASLVACGPFLAGGGSLGRAAPPTSVAPSNPAAVIKKTMRGIQSDLKMLRLDFFQLRDIENAAVSGHEFSYEMGVLHHATRLTPTSFAPYGCYIYVEIQYPAIRKEIDMRQEQGVLVSLKDGSSYALWRHLEAESTAEGQAFAEKVDQIITSRLDAMKQSLEQD